MTPLERLRQAAELLPAGASVTVTREILLAALGDGLHPSAQPPAPSADLTVAELADRFHRSPSTVRGWLEAGRFPTAYKLSGRDWRVPVAGVEAFVAQERTSRRREAPADLGAWRQHRKAVKA